MRKPHTPQPPAEAHLIKVARKAAGLSIAAAAARTVLPNGRLAISEQRWGQIEQGFEWRQEAGDGGARRRVARPVTASDEHLGHMAHAIGLKPGRLTQAGRPDGDEVLEEILRREEGRPAVPRDPAADRVREIWGDPDRAPDFIRAIAEARRDQLDDETKLAYIEKYAQDYGLLGNPQPQRRTRPA